MLTLSCIFWLALLLENAMCEPPLLSLVMIVKNEAVSIKRTILSVKGIVDRYTILDTGSTDDTVALIKSEFGDTPGEVYEEPFLDFSSTRNRVLDLEGEKSLYALMLSGDETLHEGANLRVFLSREVALGRLAAYNMRVKLGLDAAFSVEFKSARIHRTSEAWRYVGRTHEMLRHSSGALTSAYVPLPVYILHEKNMSDTIGNRDRWLEDERLLLLEWETGMNLHRTSFYLGRTYESLGNWSCAYEWYERRWQLKGWEEEEYASRFGMARALMSLNVSWSSVEPVLLSASAYRPARAEPLYEIAYHYYDVGDYDRSFEYLRQAEKVPLPDCVMSIRREVYEYLIPDLLGAVAYFVNDFEVGRRSVSRALMYKPGDKRLLRNLAYYDEL